VGILPLQQALPEIRQNRTAVQAEGPYLQFKETAIRNTLS
jgi:hypothetical protein